MCKHCFPINNRILSTLQAYLREQHARARQIVQLLCDGGAQVGVVTDTQDTLLHVAARYGLLEVSHSRLLRS